MFGEEEDEQIGVGKAFDCNRGSFLSCEVHDGRHPSEMAWTVYNGSVYVSDGAVRVTIES